MAKILSALKISYIFIILLLFTSLTNCSKPGTRATDQESVTEENKWISLFNGQNLDGWNTYLGPEIDDEGNQHGESPGLNNDVEGVFSIAQVDGTNVIRISGTRGGGISTRKEYQNYHLRLEYKWGAPSSWKIKSVRDSGLLYHAVGDYGVDWGYWMRSQEFQIQVGDTGDYWGLANAVFDIPATNINEGADYKFDPTGEMLTFSNDNEIGRHCIKSIDNENPVGDWNVLELYCSADTSVHVVNGRVNMVLYNSRILENGVETPLIKGKIEFQSEGAEIFLRSIKIKNIQHLPDTLIVL